MLFFFTMEREYICIIYALFCGMAFFLLSFVLGFLPLFYPLVLFSNLCSYPIHDLLTNCKLMADRIVLGGEIN
jgi:hypothetical protein